MLYEFHFHQKRRGPCGGPLGIGNSNVQLHKGIYVDRAPDTHTSLAPNTCEHLRRAAQVSLTSDTLLFELLLQVPHRQVPGISDGKEGRSKFTTWPGSEVGGPRRDLHQPRPPLLRAEVPGGDPRTLQPTLGRNNGRGTQSWSLGMGGGVNVLSVTEDPRVPTAGAEVGLL